MLAGYEYVNLSNAYRYRKHCLMARCFGYFEIKSQEAKRSCGGNAIVQSTIGRRTATKDNFEVRKWVALCNDEESRCTW